MKSKLSLRSRRASAKIDEIFHHFIVFALAEDLFALPIDPVVKIVPLGKVYGQNKGTEIGLTTYQDQEIIVIDLTQLLGKQTINSTPSLFPYLMILQLETMLVGLSLTSPPKVHRVPDSSLIPLPDTYLAQQTCNLLTGKMIKLDNSSPVLILDEQKINSLFQS
ncbi:MAG: chemotaxis protein CheW [Microcystaceae cyanobacterium]